jgi:hypothetical protein
MMVATFDSPQKDANFATVATAIATVAIHIPQVGIWIS